MSQSVWNYAVVKFAKQMISNRNGTQELISISCLRSYFERSNEMFRMIDNKNNENNVIFFPLKIVKINACAEKNRTNRHCFF